MVLKDHVLHGYLKKQLEEGMCLATNSDLLDLEPLGSGLAPRTYLAHYFCKGLVQRDEEIIECQDHLVGINFDDSYLRRFDTARVLTWCHPSNLFHSNVNPPFLFVGRMQPGTPLVDLLYQVFELITWQNLEVREFNALNSDACSWARRHQDQYPVDLRPLRRRQTVVDG